MDCGFGQAEAWDMDVLYRAYVPSVEKERYPMSAPVQFYI